MVSTGLTLWPLKLMEVLILTPMGADKITVERQCAPLDRELSFNSGDPLSISDSAVDLTFSPSTVVCVTAGDERFYGHFTSSSPCQCKLSETEPVSYYVFVKHIKGVAFRCYCNNN